MSDGQLQIDWILDHAEKLQLKVANIKWEVPFDTKLVDFRSAIVINGVKFTGRGTDSTEELAFLKAFSEALERSVLAQNSFKSSNGFAAHITESDAILSAKRELIERDRFLCHYLSQEPFYKPSVELKDIQIEQKIFSHLKANGFSFQLSEMKKSKDLSSFIFLIHGLAATNPKGLCFGMGCNADPLLAARSAVIEGLRHAIYYIANSTVPSLSDQEFSELVDWDPKDHQKLAINVDYAKEVVPYLFRQNDAHLNVADSTSIEDIQSEILPLPTIMNGSPFFVAKATSHSLSELFFGPTTEANVNLNRLSQFTGRNFSWDMVYKKTHPIA